MTARISHALVEIASDEAISSTRALTDWGSLSVMRATGSSSASAVADWSADSLPGSALGSSKVGSVSDVWNYPTNSGSWPTMRSSTDEGARSALRVPAASDSAWMRARRVDDSLAGTMARVRVSRRRAGCTRTLRILLHSAGPVIGDLWVEIADSAEPGAEGRLRKE